MMVCGGGPPRRGRAEFHGYHLRRVLMHALSLASNPNSVLPLGAEERGEEPLTGCEPVLPACAWQPREGRGNGCGAQIHARAGRARVEAMNVSRCLLPLLLSPVPPLYRVQRLAVCGAEALKMPVGVAVAVSDPVALAVGVGV